MTSLNDLLASEFNKHNNPTSIMARIIVRKYVELGYLSKSNAEVALTSIRGQLDKLQASNETLGVIEGGRLSISLDDSIFNPSSVSELAVKPVDISVEDVERDQQLFQEVTTDVVAKILGEMSDKLAEGWKKASERELIRIKRAHTDCTLEVHQVWGTALDSEIFIDLCTSIGSEFNSHHRVQPAKSKDYRLDALTRIHARSCQVAREIHILLRNGYADGAVARWRTLDELAVIAEVLAKYSNMTSKRYLLHSIIDEHKLMVAFQTTAQILGWSPIPAWTITAAKKQVDRLVAKYGKTYATDYGWASHDFGNKEVRFAELKSVAGRENFNVPFKMAHKYVHASSYGTLFPLNALPLANYLPVGGSIFGLCEPGKQTAQAICSITATLLTSKTRAEDMISLRALIPIRDEVWKEFDDAKANISERLRRKRIRKIRIVK